jgi:capsular exopolysaccharide synthesis family protein
VTKTVLNRQTIVINPAQNAVNIKKIKTILQRHRFLVLGISCVVMSATSLLAVITKPTYQSSMQIMVSSNLDTGISSINFSKDTKTNSIDTNISVIDDTAQMKLMLSSNLIQKAVYLLRANYPNITLEDIKGNPEANKHSSLEVTKITGTSGVKQTPNQVFAISFKDHDPVKAQRVLQALQKVYQDYNLEHKKQRLNQGLAFVNNRLPKAQQEVKNAEQKLEKFRQKYNLFEPAIQSKILLESLADIQKQRQTNRAQLQTVQERYKDLQQQLTTSRQNAQISPPENQSISYQSLLAEIQKTEFALAQARLRYQDNYPTVEKLKQQRQIQLSLLQQEAAKNAAESLVAVDSQLVNELNQLQKTAFKLLTDDQNLGESEKRIRSQLSAYPNLISQYNRMLSDVDAQRKILQQLLQEQQFLGFKIAQSGFEWQVLDEPNLGIYLGGRRLLLLISGLLLGPILGISVALIRASFNNAIFSVKDLQKLTNLRLLGSVPKLGINSRNKKSHIWFWQQQRKSETPILEENNGLPVHETLDMIYQNIEILKHPFSGKSLMLTSALPQEGKTTLALGLGASAAHMHRRVLVIDANLRYPRLHKILELSNDWGLSLLLIDETNNQIHDYIQPIHPAIDILTAGPTPEDAVHLLSSQRMQELIQSFEETYDLVLIDAPAILNTVDARIVASFCNGIVMVGKIGQITPNQLIQTTEILSKLNLIGIVANEVSDAEDLLES